ncbi:MAG TPA: Rieske 2Fe-2S domain-containing protein [Thermoplasmata archaeon]|jgi:nitrite reductase/ring-hydroxylating ferredoxin subunit|nr:Rieske 2Fe-2S domain-containing protein [Thermoplasmata archaeon]
MDPVAVAKVGDVRPGESKVVLVLGRPVALFNVNGTFYATDNTCLHRGGPVGEGFLDGAIVTCPLHGWQYDVKTGQNLANPAAQLRTYRVIVAGDIVKIAP